MWRVAVPRSSTIKELHACVLCMGTCANVPGVTTIFLKGMNLRESNEECLREVWGGNKRRQMMQLYYNFKKVLFKKPINTNSDNKTVETV